MTLPVPEFLKSDLDALRRFAGAAVILDLSRRETAFREAVNEAQLSRIRNRLAASSLGYFSRLPLAAKVYVCEAIRAGVPDLEATLGALDEACARAATMFPPVARRWQSGIYVKLPVFGAQISVERDAFSLPVDPGLKAAIRQRRSASLRSADEDGSAGS